MPAVNGATVGDFLSNQIAVVNNATIELTSHGESRNVCVYLKSNSFTPPDIIKLIEPPTSIMCNKTNTSAINFVKGTDDFLYLLSVNELLAIEIEGQKRAKLHFVGTLLEISDTIKEVQIKNWQNMIIVVLKLPEVLQIYSTKRDFSAPEDLKPIQRINVNSASDQFELLRNGEDLFMTIYEINNSSANEFVYYKWQNSFFSKESAELLDLPNDSDLFVAQENSNTPLVLAIGYGNATQSTRLVAFQFNQETNRWIKTQSMHFKQNYIEHYVIGGKLFLIGCSTDGELH